MGCRQSAALAERLTPWRRKLCEYLKNGLNGHGGMILLDQRGRFGIAHNTPRMAWAYKNTEREDVGINC